MEYTAKMEISGTYIIKVNANNIQEAEAKIREKI